MTRHARLGAALCLLTGLLALGAGPAAAEGEPADPAAPPSETEEGEVSEPRPRRLPAGPERPLAHHLPDGYFVGRWQTPGTPEVGSGQEGTLAVHVVHGVIITAELTVPTEPPRTLSLTPRGARDEVDLGLAGRAGRDFVRLGGRFWHPVAASGQIDGVIDGQKVDGRWTLRRL